MENGLKERENGHLLYSMEEKSVEVSAWLSCFFGHCTTLPDVIFSFFRWLEHLQFSKIRCLRVHVTDCFYYLASPYAF